MPVPTITLQQTINALIPNGRYRPVSFSGGILEPALTMANTIKMAILGPPFRWRWNRSDVSPMTLITGTQDYTQPVPNFGWLESASCKDPSDSQWRALGVNMDLDIDSAQERPREVAPEYELGDSSGNIIFRFLPNPDKNYTVQLTFQKKCTLFAALTDLWAPIPDDYSYIYNWGFLAMYFMLIDDPRFQMANQKFVAHLLATQQGLDQTQVNIFLSQWQYLSGSTTAQSVAQTQGEQARGV